MSQYFEMGDETLWNPSTGASRLFLRQVAVFEAELGLPSGFGPMVDDECRIDPAAFETFANALLARHRRTDHAVVSALSEGFTTTVVVLAQRAEIELDWARPRVEPDSPRDDVQVSALTGASVPAEDGLRASRLREAAANLSRFMSR